MAKVMMKTVILLTIHSHNLTMKKIDCHIEDGKFEQLEEYRLDNNIKSVYRTVQLAIDKLLESKPKEEQTINEDSFIAEPEKKEIARQIERTNFDAWVKQLRERDSGKV